MHFKKAISIQLKINLLCSDKRITECLVFDFYTIAFKSVHNGKMKYGQQLFDFDSGMMGFSSPGQVIRVEVEEGKPVELSGWLLLIHPDFLWNTPLAKK